MDSSGTYSAVRTGNLLATVYDEKYRAKKVGESLWLVGNQQHEQ